MNGLHKCKAEAHLEFAWLGEGATLISRNRDERRRRLPLTAHVVADGAIIQHRRNRLHDRIVDPANRATPHGYDLVTRTQTALRSQRVGLHLSDHRPDPGYAVQIERGIGQPSKQEIGTRAGEQHRNAMRNRASGECPRSIGLIHGPVTFVGQAHIATQRNRREHVLRAITTHAPEQRTPKTDGEPQHFEAESTRHPEMAVLVHRDQHADHHNVRQYLHQSADQIVSPRPATTCRATCRATASAANMPSSPDRSVEGTR